MKNPVYSGKRKTAIAKATIVAGKGNIRINRKPMEFYPELQKLELEEPIRIAKDVLGKFPFDISVNVKGGGIASQIEASRLAIARAIVGESKSEKLKGIIEALGQEKAIKINDKMVEEFQKSEDNYKQITKILTQEIEVHLGFYSRYISEEAPKEIAVHKDESGNFGDYISKSTKLIKNFVRKRQKEINVIFSRYENGFNNQLRRLGTVEAYLKSQKKA